MDLNILSKYINSDDITALTAAGNGGNGSLHDAFSAELNMLQKNGFESKIDAYKNIATGTTTVAIGLSQKGLHDNYVLVKNKWDDNKWDMTILDNQNNESSPVYSNIDNSLWLVSHGLEKTIPNQFSIKGLTIEQVLKLCE